MENIPFFISPPYQVPPINWMRSVKLNATKFSEFKPCSFQFGLVHLEPFITTKLGLKSFNSASVGRINIFFTKCACHATSVTIRTAIRSFSLAPQKPSITNKRLPESSLVTMSFKLAQVSWVIGLLSFFAASEVHHTVSLVVSSKTIYLSLGERPVKMPVSTATAPVVVTVPFSKPSKPGLVSSSKSCS